MSLVSAGWLSKELPAQHLVGLAIPSWSNRFQASFLGISVRYFSPLQLPSISMRREVSACPEEPVTPLRHEPNPPLDRIHTKLRYEPISVGRKEDALSVPPRQIHVRFHCLVPPSAIHSQAKCKGRQLKAPSKDGRRPSRFQHSPRRSAFRRPVSLWISNHDVF